MTLPAPAVLWRFDEGTGTTISDGAAGGANPATLTNGTWVPGRYGNGIHGGSNHAATFTLIDMARTYTIGFWLRGWNGSTDGIVIGGAAGMYVAYLDATDIYHSSQSHFVTVAHGGGLSDGNWHHLAVVRAEGDIQFYKDGRPLGALQTNGSFNGASELQIKSLLAYFDGTFPFPADLDDVRMYSTAFTAAQIADLYNPVPAMFLGL